MSSTLYILPSTAAVEAFARDNLVHTGVMFGTQAVTLRRLAEEIFTAADETRRHISNVGRRLLLEEIVCERYRDQTGHFHALRELPGFIGALDTLFAELKQALITPADFAATVARAPGDGRLPELAGLYLHYDRSLSAKGLLDRHDQELAALDHLHQGGGLPPLFRGVSAARCLGIYDLSPLQLALLAELSRRFPVELTLPWNPRREALYAYVTRTADAVEALDNADLQLEPVFAEPSGKFLTPLLAAIFDGEGAGPEIAGNMALIAAPGPYRECEEIGRRIRRLLEAGTDPVAIAVVVRELQRYGPMIEDVCRRFKIPVSYRRGAPLFTSPLVRACLAPFAVVGSRFAREELLGLIKSSYLDRFASGISLDAIEDVLIAAGYMDEKVGDVEAILKKRIDWLKSQDRGVNREEGALAALKPLLAELRLFRTRQTLQAFTALLERYIDRHHIYHRAITAGDPLTLKRDASAITLFRQVLHDLGQDMRTLGIADEPLEPSEFVTLLKQGMEGAFLAGERGAGVAILNFHDARGLSFDHFFVGGLNEGVCPMSREGHPLFKDADKLLLRRISGTQSFRTAKEKSEEEQLLFYLALGCANTSLTFSYSYINSQGNEMLPSPFLDELLAKVPLDEERIPVNRITPVPAECLEREEFLNSLAAHHLFSVAQDGVSCLEESLARIEGAFRMEAERERFFETEEKTLRGKLATPHTGKLLREDILGELRLHYESSAGNRFAPTTLEDYGCCPFRFFLRRVLKLSTFDKPDMELAAREEGSLVHEILCAFFHRLQQEGRLPLRDAAGAKAILGEEATPVFERWERERHIGQPLLWEVEKERLLVLLGQLAEIEADDRSRFVPVLFEHPFEDLVVEDKDGSRIVLAGKIDRVDASAGNGEIRVVDYKMGGDAGKYRALMKKEQLGRTSFQMPVYLLAAARAMATATATNGPVTRFNATYWLLRKLCMLNKDFDEGKEDFTGFFVTDPVSRGVLGDDNFANRVAATVQAIKSGDFQITPDECQYCDFGCICRHVEVRLRDDAADGD